ncbi:hypothetical protein [Nocardia anaemiae]|uniref:hypothetical protein n=1 Tax=Nocardia anaemiae TaxID=263910 RepID=UPI000B2668D7|nr:hypothetical protein [Nocardia anaemiae]
MGRSRVQSDMSDIEYVFGTGDGTVHVWTSQTDVDISGSGLGDAVALDFDGDGLVDDVLWDSHGTGIADVAGLDLDDDGVVDHFFTDPTGNGTWNHQITGNPADADSEQLAWIERTEPEPDHLAADELGAVLSNHQEPIQDLRWSDPHSPIEQVAALRDHRTWSGDESGDLTAPFNQ